MLPAARDARAAEHSTAAATTSACMDRLSSMRRLSEQMFQQSHHFVTQIREPDWQEISMSLSWFLRQEPAHLSIFKVIQPRAVYDQSHLSHLIPGCYVEKAPNAWHRRGTHIRQETPTIDHTARQPTQLIGQAPGTIERAALGLSFGVLLVCKLLKSDVCM